MGIKKTWRGRKRRREQRDRVTLTKNLWKAREDQRSTDRFVPLYFPALVTVGFVLYQNDFQSFFVTYLFSWNLLLKKKVSISLTSGHQTSPPMKTTPTLSNKSKKEKKLFIVKLATFFKLFNQFKLNLGLFYLPF